MKIPMELIQDSMSHYSCTLSRASKKKFKGWYQVIYWNEKMEVDEDFLLFGRAIDFPKELTNRGIICIGEPELILLEQNDVLIFKEEEDSIHQIYLEIQNIFLKFSKWEDSLRLVLTQKTSLKTLFSLAFEVFGNSIFLHDENFYLLARTDEMPRQMSWEYDSIRKGYVIPMEILNDFKVNPDYLATMTTTEPSIFPADTFGYRILYQNLWYNGQYRGRICVNELRRKIRTSDFYLLNYFSQLVIEFFRADEFYIKKYTPSLSKLLICLLEGESLSSSTLAEVLLYYGWTVDDEYFCACLVPNEMDIRTHSIQYFCSKISNTFAHTCAFPYKNSIIILVNSTMSELTISAFKSQMGLLLRESLMKAGISLITNDLTQFPYMYHQAICALETGRKKHNTFWSYSFDDYKMDFIFQNALQEFPAELLCSKEIFLLKEYDTSHTSELVKTLKVYLENNLNLAKTSQILGIHRSTLLYRVGKIKELIHSNLENSKKRFELLLSYYLLDENGRQI